VPNDPNDVTRYHSKSRFEVALFLRFTYTVATFLSVVCIACGCGASQPAASWTSANADASSSRALDATDLDAASIARLTVRWRFRLGAGGSSFGAVTANPIVSGDTVYIQDTRSSVYALDLETGALRWKHAMAAPNDGPNGLTVSGSRIYGATDTTVFALDAANGHTLWSRRLVNRFEQFIAVAPLVDRGRAYLSTQGFPPGGRGAVYALSAATGRVLWRFATIAKPWPHPQAGGGGIWYPVSVDGDGNVYAGISNPGPWGGSKAFPNGGWFGRSTLYTDSLVVLAGATGKLLWFDQVTPHDVRDYDFEASPILATLGGKHLVFGAGKAGRVVAWNRDTHARVWSRAVGTHLHDLGPLPGRETTVCPGFLGGVETPMALADGRLFVPVVELCARESATTSQNAFLRPPSEGSGAVYALDAATGKTAWQRQLGSPPFGCATVARDAVIVPTYDGTLVAFAASDGRRLWRARLPAGNNSCPAVTKKLLIVAAGAPYPGRAQHGGEIVAFGVGK
jgi:outer membrane protein assembly factor BamB